MFEGSLEVLRTSQCHTRCALLVDGPTVERLRVPTPLKVFSERLPSGLYCAASGDERLTHTEVSSG